MRCLDVVDQRPPSATNADADAMIRAARRVTTPDLPKAIRSIQYAASNTANKKRKSGTSQESQRAGVDPHGGRPIPRTMFDANGIPMPSVTKAPIAAYGRAQRISGRARRTAYTAIKTSAEPMQSAPAVAGTRPASRRQE